MTSLISLLQLESHGHKSKRINGILPGFDANAQHIDVSGDHEFLPPGHDDLRGPCPGLDALTNHNYLPHDGVATIDQFIEATNQVFGMCLDLATFLSTYGAVLDGDLTSWSIGGPPGDASLLAGLLSQPQGISGSHNKYETDGSPTRGDPYQYGNDFLVQLSRFKALYDKQSGVPNDAANYNLDILNNFRAERLAQSKAENPSFFSAPFSGLAVRPTNSLHIHLPLRFMANRSADHPEGVPNKDVLRSFFSITGENANSNTTPATNASPQTGTNAPSATSNYTIPFLATDLNLAALEHPEPSSPRWAEHRHRHA
ncbi:hypothetical protein LTR70_005114 [Exophiala xenobiotica]|uniref:Heme haloperoxidase family profile domain-containing protein n=1 Tax=Lithohypha guttulata TaxID=1690604 RepID=A0ABR0KC88_9EURO|nr:hypothetical protein LTR24_004838 [Lithohypha guttulata]KAK5319213.1 hypothetical protein LTR70_005114 [Exophiala xenobiotica]